MNKQAYEHMVGLVLDKNAYDMAKFKDVDDYVNNGTFGKSLGTVKGQELRRNRYNRWSTINQTTAAAQQNGTYKKGQPINSTMMQGQPTSVNGRPVANQPVQQAPAVRPPVQQAPAVQPKRNKIMLPETEWISPEASEF